MQGIFDIIGPVMIGPSSSHTAGAARLGAMGRKIFGRVPQKVEFYLHGSFAKTYRGHGTDKALVAGIMGLAPDNVLLKESLHMAEKEGLSYFFFSKDLGDVHPNTVMMVLSDDRGSMTIQGASIGGGVVCIHRIDDFEVEFSGEYNSLITIHQDKPGIVAAISTELAELSVNIAFMRVFREGRGRRALMVIETDQVVPTGAIAILKGISGIEKVMVIPALE